MNNNKLKIYFGSELSNLYDVGYLSTDIQQIIAFSEMINNSDLENVEKYFGEPVKGLNRYAKPLEKFAKSSEIIWVRKGSLELVISGMGLASAIIVPIAIAKVQHQLKKEGIERRFEISPEDKNLRIHLNAYERGKFGHGIEALNYLFEVLSRLKYKTSIVAEHAYRIDHVTDKYAGRMVRTIKRNYEK